MNDVHSPKFESKLDPFFTSKHIPNERFGRLDQDTARSALATTRPTRFWAQGIKGVSSPVKKI